MAIYISGVKGLPEQVQENKENIKKIQEEIEGIDFEEIRQLEGQVDENTGDINNLEGAIGVQNIAIESINDTIDDNLKPRIQTLETKTSVVSYDSQTNVLTIDSSAKVNGNIYANVMLDENQRGAITLPENANESVVILNNSSGTLHSLIFDKDGNLLIDGNPAGKTYYRHNLLLRQSGGNQKTFKYSVINTIPTAMSESEVATHLYNAGAISRGTGFTIMPPAYGIGFEMFSSDQTTISIALWQYSTDMYIGNNNYATIISDTIETL